MNDTIAIEHVSSWMRDPYAYDPQARERWFTVNGQRFTAHSNRSEGPEQWPLVVRDAITGEYVCTVSNWRLLSEQLAARLAQGEMTLFKD